MAQERCEELGYSTGYSVRFESVLPRHYASLLFCTVGEQPHWPLANVEFSYFEQSKHSYFLTISLEAVYQPSFLKFLDFFNLVI